MVYDSALRVRIPPSPTGPLHLGTARTALYNYLLSQRYGGRFIFRLEDTDRERSKSEYVSDIINGLHWLGLNWHEGPLRQSEHQARHQMVVQELLKQNLAYECFCSTDELEAIKAEQRAQNKVEGYDNRHRTLTFEQKKAFREAGRKPVIRFKLPDDYLINWQDLVRGQMQVNSADLGGDPVIAKDNGDILYNFAVVIDDHDAGITHIIRGEDHLHNTAKQIPIYEALNWQVPEFAHVPLILTANREKLSKRKHGDIASISNYIQAGYLPEAIVNYLLAMSWQISSEQEVFTLEEAVPVFALEDLSKSPAVYDPQKLHWFCKEHFKRLSTEEVLQRAEPFLQAAKVNLQEYAAETQLKIIGLIKDGLTTLSEIPVLLSPLVFEPDFDNLPENAKNSLQEPKTKEILTTLSQLLAENQNAFEPQILLNALAEQTQLKKGKKLFWPLRAALFGNTSGPELTALFEILGAQKLQARLQKALEFLD